jgi:hypothetical protein
MAETSGIVRMNSETSNTVNENAEAGLERVRFCIDDEDTAHPGRLHSFGTRQNHAKSVWSQNDVQQPKGKPRRPFIEPQQEPKRLKSKL